VREGGALLFAHSGEGLMAAKSSNRSISSVVPISRA
jgi:hypothetical protein